ncbi:YczE/YyaS/YitT family protein [Bifidobacterium moukalabense]|uniref:Membrane protein n=1 Tax=Bifidobacterium moukalabense DSM 27321 TaxID=1435051 RepID=W4N8Z4_9BIFI|nr:DUF6198 family protein [Bifidobacterium moukalabense]ETY71527.1 membrane protein [Bifidobacterium moukalabense DSM 27321]
MNHLLRRYLYFILGVVINSFAIAFITKGDMGTSQISSVPYVLSLKYPLSFGATTFIFNLLFIIMQIALLRRDFRPVQLLQVAVNLVFSLMIDVSMNLLGFLDPTALWERLLCVAVGCVILAFGIVIEVSPNVLMVPGEGIVHALSTVTKVRLGTTKIIFDVTLIAIAVVLSFVFFGGLCGVGMGTVVSALCVGPVINCINRWFRFPARIRALSLVTDRNR